MADDSENGVLALLGYPSVSTTRMTRDGYSDEGDTPEEMHRREKRALAGRTQSGKPIRVLKP